ncbi:hypothetical protein P3X46_019847 [Hevea brasiliensis]|uniref:RING-type domain-containing protein n=1 Tax=Hevea brasiliensis TaxID=3981 RepID=A0ABQ9LJZ4_HEVBR|nr:hypothetical protein P3X46_019847 [Hevea brasiliensis]
MNQLGVFLIIPCFFFHVKAQNTWNSHSGILNPLHPTLAAVIGIISIMLSVTFLILAYSKFCHRNTIDDLLVHDTNHQNFLGLSSSRSRFSGIDRAVIDSLPFFRFSSLKGSKQGLECAVCLSIFEETEILRLLPNCKHAFHKNCIDQWLESHSSCPLCRYKFDPKDLKSFSFSNSLRYLQNPSNLSEDPNLELFVQREQDYHGQELLHKFKHKIIVSDVIIKNRWSDVNSSDLLFLNSEMLNVMSSTRFSPANSSSCTGFSMNENIEKIKEDLERKRLYESKISKADRSDSFSTSCLLSTSYQEESSRQMINPAEMRSMSEITIYSRFKELNVRNKIKESLSPRSSSEKEDRIRKLWLPTARRTVQWFAGQERNLQELEYKRQTSNV